MIKSARNYDIRFQSSKSSLLTDIGHSSFKRKENNSLAFTEEQKKEIMNIMGDDIIVQAKQKLGPGSFFIILNDFVNAILILEE